MLAQHLGASLAADTRRERRQLRLDAGVQRAGHRPRRHVQADDHRLRARCSTTSARSWTHERGRRRSSARRRVYLLLWIFLAGGIIDRYARDRPTRAHGFFARAACSSSGFCGSRSAQAVVYGFLFGALHPWLFDRLYPRMIHDVTVERTAFFARLALYVVFGVLVAAGVR